LSSSQSLKNALRANKAKSRRQQVSVRFRRNQPTQYLRTWLQQRWSRPRSMFKANDSRSAEFTKTMTNCNKRHCLLAKNQSFQTDLMLLWTWLSSLCGTSK
jgi:hypothetical protein